MIDTTPFIQCSRFFLFLKIYTNGIMFDKALCMLQY